MLYKGEEKIVNELLPLEKIRFESNCEKRRGRFTLNHKNPCAILIKKKAPRKGYFYLYRSIVYSMRKFDICLTLFLDVK